MKPKYVEPPLSNYERLICYTGVYLFCLTAWCLVIGCVLMSLGL